jgi:hypothetical protein
MPVERIITKYSDVITGQGLMEGIKRVFFESRTFGGRREGFRTSETMKKKNLNSF